MNTFVSRAKDFLRSEDGPTATEYAVMLALIIVVSLATITTLGGTEKGVFSNVDAKMTALPAG